MALVVALRFDVGIPPLGDVNVQPPTPLAECSVKKNVYDKIHQFQIL